MYIIGASLGSPHLVESTAALSVLGHYKLHSWFPSTARMPSSARLEALKAGIDSKLNFNLSRVALCKGVRDANFVTVSIYDSSCSRTPQSGQYRT